MLLGISIVFGVSVIFKFFKFLIVISMASNYCGLRVFFNSFTFLCLFFVIVEAIN